MRAFCLAVLDCRTGDVSRYSIAGRKINRDDRCEFHDWRKVRFDEPYIHETLKRYVGGWAPGGAR